ncbi:MAG: HigA family addiction module antidote protein [Muribaculaceae bacterium]|nr:HigA family addiction module antidote protein [Muribaculaceae bacterium]
MINLPDINPQMIANNLISFEPTHPGELLLDELQCRELSQAKFASQIGVKPSLLNEIIKGKRSVNAEMALLFEAALGISANIWIKLQNEYNLQKAKSDASFMSRLAAIRRIAAVL